MKIEEAIQEYVYLRARETEVKEKVTWMLRSRGKLIHVRVT